MRAGVWVLAIGIAAGCKAQRNEAKPTTVAVPPPTRSTSPIEPSLADASARPRSGPFIMESGIGDVVIGEPIPSHYFTEQPRYEARWIADAQPMEGFWIGKPPFWATFKGPLYDATPGPLDELMPKLEPKALALAKQGARVSAILVEQAGITTEAGIGVGSSFESLEQAHGPVSLLVNPEIFDSKQTCDATGKSLPNVHFLLESCPKSGERGPVKRVFVHRPLP